VEQGGRQGKVYSKDYKVYSKGYKAWKARALVLLIVCGDDEVCSWGWDRGSSSYMLEQGDNHSWGRLDSHICVHSNLVYHKILMVLARDQLKVLARDQRTSCGDDGVCS